MSCSTNPLPIRPADDPTDAPLLAVMLSFLRPLLMAGGVSDAALAEAAARRAIASYQAAPGAQAADVAGGRAAGAAATGGAATSGMGIGAVGMGGEALLTITQIVGYALAGLDALGSAAAPALSLTTKLKLRGNANALNRTSRHEAAALALLRAAEADAMAAAAERDVAAWDAAAPDAAAVLASLDAAQAMPWPTDAAAYAAAMHPPAVAAAAGMDDTAGVDDATAVAAAASMDQAPGMQATAGMDEAAVLDEAIDVAAAEAMAVHAQAPDRAASALAGPLLTSPLARSMQTASPPVTTNTGAPSATKIATFGAGQGAGAAAAAAAGVAWTETRPCALSTCWPNRPLTHMPLAHNQGAPSQMALDQMAANQLSHNQVWANAMIEVAADCRANLARLTPAQRRLEMLRIAALQATAQSLGDGRMILPGLRRADLLASTAMPEGVPVVAAPVGKARPGGPATGEKT